MASASDPVIVQPDRAGPEVPAGLSHCIRRVAAWSADRQSTGLRRRIQIALGLLWLLDAALQYQPYMFSPAFPMKILSSSAVGSPGLVAAPVMVASHLMLHNVMVWNAVFATAQLALAAGLLCRLTVKAALAATIVWSVAVWWLGESLGGIFTGAASPLSGAPGAVILYALVAILAWPSPSGDRQHATVAGGSPFGARWSRRLWLVLWGSSAYLMLQTPNRAPGALRASLAGLAAGEPHWIAAMDRACAGAAGRAGTLLPVLLAVTFATIGVAILIPSVARLAVPLSIVAALSIWTVGENFGGILTGQATDPNTGPLLALVALAFWPLNTTQPGGVPVRWTPAGQRAGR
jgi:hypothetical protein